MPDRRVQAAIDHWAPRFITMGVDYNDFVRTTGRIERWEEWLPEWSETADEHLSLARDAEEAGRGRSAGEAYLHAALCLHFGEFFHWENVFLTRGMATLSMDGPGQGESGFTLPIRADYEVAVAAFLDELSRRAEPRIDLTRVGAAGVSLGGYYAPRAAAFEPRIRAVAAISGPYDFGEIWEQLPPLTREAFTVFGTRPPASDERDARARAGELSLHGVAARITQPALFVTGGLDRIVPWEQTERAASETPNGSFVLYAQGSHVCSNVPYRYRPLVGDWMAERLAPAG